LRFFYFYWKKHKYKPIIVINLEKKELIMRFLTAGESHGKCLTTIIEGVPAGLFITVDHINSELARRQSGYGRGGRMKIEKDTVEISSGVRGGYTLGSPIALTIINKDWENWKTIMSPTTSADLKSRFISRPRPGHTDLFGAIKYGHQDMRNVLERSSARETAARVAVGSIAKRILSMLDVDIFSHVIRIGQQEVKRELSFEEIKKNAPNSPVFCADSKTESEMLKEIEQCKLKGDTLGGIFEVIALNLPIGLGSYVHWDRKLDGRLAQSVMSIQAIKAVEIGMGKDSGELPGSKVHDEIMYDSQKGFYQKTNRAGGLIGGITTGAPLRVRATMKPIPTLMQPLSSVDFISKVNSPAATERSDVCAVPAASVVGEAAVAWVLAQAFLEMFGCDQMQDICKRVQEYRTYVRQI
jgi:chorismate synthase